MVIEAPQRPIGGRWRVSAGRCCEVLRRPATRRRLRVSALKGHSMMSPTPDTCEFRVQHARALVGTAANTSNPFGSRTVNRRATAIIDWSQFPPDSDHR